MNRLICFGLTLVTGCGLFLSGCGTGGGVKSRHSQTTPPRGAKVPKPTAQAQSHARYADGVIFEMKGDLSAAMDSFAQAVALDPEDEELLLDVTRRFLQYKHPERALPLLTSAVAGSRASGLVYARLGFVYAQLGQTDRAIAANQAAIRKLPTLLAAHQNLYLNYLQNKQEDQAFQTLDTAAKVPDADADFLASIAELYANLGLLAPTQRTNVQPRARALLLRAADLAPTNTATRLKLAEGFHLLGDAPRAIEFYRAALDDLGDNPPVRDAVRSKLADLYLRTRDRDRAAELLREILRDDPTNAQANFVLGSLAFEDKRMEQAAEHFGRTVLLNPRFEQAYFDLAIAQINLNRLDDALTTLEQARERFRQNFLVEYLSGVAHTRRQDYTNAVQYFTAAEVIAQAGETNRLTAAFYFQVGAALERGGRFDDAVVAFEKCLQLAPDFAEAQNYLGYMWADRGVNLDRARELIEKAVKADPDNAAYLDSLGWVLFKLGKPHEALDAMFRAIQCSESPDPTLYDHLGDIHAVLGEMEEARDAWQKSLELEPNETIQKKLDGTKPQ